MSTQTRYIHLTTGEVIETRTEAENGQVTVVTIAATGRHINLRTIRSNALKATYLNRRGTPYQRGYVPLASLPFDHPFTAPDLPIAAEPRPVLETPDLEELSDEALSAFAFARKAERDLADSLLEEAKNVIKSRTQDAGTRIFGDVAVVTTTNQRFNADLAKKLLDEVTYRSICVPKPDAAQAKRVLGESRYMQVCKDHGFKLEVRGVTDADHEALAAAQDAEHARHALEMVDLGVAEINLDDFDFPVMETTAAPFG